MGTQKYMLTKRETSYSNFLAVMERQGLGLNYNKINRAARRFKERGGAAFKHQYFQIMQITNHNLCVKFESKCNASNALLHRENTKIVSNYRRTQLYTGNTSHLALIKKVSNIGLFHLISAPPPPG